MLRVGRIDYLNSLPLYTAFDTGVVSTKVQWKYGPPALLNQMLHQGKLDVALCSSWEYLQNRDRYTLLQPFCIAAKRKVLSVNFYYKGDLKDLDHQIVGVTNESKSSAQLLKVLCKHFWKITPRFQVFKKMEHLVREKGFLLIGDKALSFSPTTDYKKIDLAEAWHESTGFPFAFATLIARKDIVQGKKERIDEFLSDLDMSLKWGMRHLDSILDIAHAKSGLEKPLLNTYFNSLCYKIGPEEEQALQLFSTLANDLSLSARKT